LKFKTEIKLFNRDFLLLWQGQTVSQIGTQLHHIAIIFWLKQTTGSAGLMGTIMMVSMLPAVILGPVAGTFADRFSRKKIIVFSDLVMGLCSLSIAALFFVKPEATSLAITWLLFCGILSGIALTVFQPAIMAAVPDLVPTHKLNAANSLQQSTAQVSMILGQGLGGVLYRILGAPVLMLVDGITYLFSAISECFIRIPQKLPEKINGKKSVLSDYKKETIAGLRFVWQRKGLKKIMMMHSFMSFLMAPFPIVLPFYIEDKLNVTSDWFGYMMAGISFGMLLGYLIASIVDVKGKRRVPVIIFFELGVGIYLILLSFVSSPVAALVLFVLAGVHNGIISTYLLSIFQMTIPSEMRGRVFGLMATLSTSLAPISMGMIGVIMEIVHNNVGIIFMVQGVAYLCLILLVAADRHCREFFAYQPDSLHGRLPVHTD